jgi:hypothetical protein
LNRRISAYSRILGITVALATANGILAQESAGPNATSGRAPSAITGAKKEFESIKSLRDAALISESGLPQVNLPALPPTTGPGTAPNSAKQAKSDATKPNAGNWLIEAMEKNDDDRAPRGEKSSSHARRGNLREEKDGAKGADVGTRDLAQQEGEGRKEGGTSVVVNPLTRYLDEWMTPQDYALLKPGLMQRFDPRPDAANSPALNVGVAGLSGGLNEFTLGGVATSAPVRDIPKENPYLQSLKPDLALPATPVRSNVFSVPEARLPGAKQIAPPPPIPALAPARIPDFAKPGSDEKYFKQLKRF